MSQALLCPVAVGSWWEQRTSETGPDWAGRIQSFLLKEIERKKEEGFPTSSIMLMFPPAFLRKLYSVTFACNLEEAERLLIWEKNQSGFVQFVGHIVISNDTIKRPDIKILGDLQKQQRRTRMARSRFGGKHSKKTK